MAVATRQRIVEATLQLHIERGVLGTSMRDIAARADVAPGTVARHFPDYEDIVTACGKPVRERYPAPTSEIFHGPSTIEERVERLVMAWFHVPRGPTKLLLPASRSGSSALARRVPVGSRRAAPCAVRSGRSMHGRPGFASFAPSPTTACGEAWPIKARHRRRPPARCVPCSAPGSTPPDAPASRGISVFGTRCRAWPPGSHRVRMTELAIPLRQRYLTLARPRQP
jgi:AcrR family transcriptional regulator